MADGSPVSQAQLSNISEGGRQVDTASFCVSENVVFSTCDTLTREQVPLQNTIQHFSESGENSLISNLASFPLMNRLFRLIV